MFELQIRNHISQLGYRLMKYSRGMVCRNDLPTPSRNDLFCYLLNFASHSFNSSGYEVDIHRGHSLRLAPRYLHNWRLWKQLAEFYLRVINIPELVTPSSQLLDLKKHLRDLIGCGIVFGAMEGRRGDKDEFLQILQGLFDPDIPENTWPISYHKGLH